jgi:three-Cys-motif partner protein
MPILVPSTYQGREHTYVKHCLLSSYLEKLLFIIGMSSAKLGISEVCYVDCFAGPWADTSEELSSTSISISLSILNTCRKEMEQRGIHLSFRALYVESDPNTFDRLESFIRARTPEGIQAKPMKGDFVALRPEILQWCGERSFVFFFIDPTGWTEVAVRTLQPLLQRRRSEFLINFMYDFVNRTVSMQAWQEEMATLLGEPVNLDGMNARERERVLLETYRRNLKRQMGFDVGQPRSAYVRVLDREKERPKYHLVYLTNHPRGIIEFMEISEGLDIVQKRVRAETKRAARATKSGMGDLFGC